MAPPVPVCLVQGSMVFFEGEHFEEKMLIQPTLANEMQNKPNQSHMKMK